MAAGKTYIGRRRGLGELGGLAVVVCSSAGVESPLAHYVRHSPTGFECGYHGSGPADLARCILIDHLGLHSLADRETVIPRVDKHYQDFKDEIVAELERDGFELTAEVVDNWLKGRR